jgi:hypothetical protein
VTVQTLRPNSQDFLNTVTRVPNVSAELNLDDAVADPATYVHGTTTGSGVRLGLTTYTLAAGERVRYVTPRAGIFRNPADGHAEYVHFRLRDSANGKQTTLAQLGTTALSPGVIAAGPAQAAGPGGVAWSQALVDRLQADVAWLSVAGSDYLRVYEVYVDLDINAQPVVSAVTAAGATTTTRPSWTFTYTDADGDPQTRWRVKVFSAAQYGAAGFDPGTSASTWDSGDQSGNSAAGTITTDLVNGVTYRFYARAAQDWPGPEGALWWSAWAASSNFIIALQPPITPSIVATAQTGVPEYRVRLDITAPVNLLSADEGDFEVALGSWVASVNCAVVRSTTLPANGVADMQMTATGAGTMSAEIPLAGLKPVLGSTQYTAVASFRSAVTARSVNVKLRWYDRTALLSTTSGSNVTDGTGGYVQAVVTATSPANAVYGAVVVEVVSAAAAEVHRVDMVSLHRGATTAWTPGGALTSATLLVERAERVFSNFRGAAANWASPQLATGGGLTRNTDGWYTRAAGLLASSPLDGAPLTGADGAAQARMIVWRPTTGAGSFLDFGLDTAATTDPTPPFVAPAVVGLPTRVAVWAKTRSGTFAARLFAYTVDAANTVVTTANSSAVTLTTAWQRLTVDITPGAGSVYLRGAVENNTPTVEVDVCVTGVRICPTSADDGATPPGQGIFPYITWESVRPVDALTPASPGETYTMYDHEVPPGRPVLYRVTTQALVSAQAVASAPSPPVAVYMAPPARTVLKSWEPENAMVVQVARGDTFDRGEDAQVFHPLGRDLDPVTVRDWRSGRDAQLNVAALTDQELYRLEQLLPSATSLLIQWSEGGCTYARVVGYTSTRVVRGSHRLTVAYRETLRP